jgi:predicted short-subunit dehydrogenase-like oxidoreductase (DUF2520 family)
VIRIVLLGSGNVAFHLHRALRAASGVELVQMVARRSDAFSEFEPGVPRGILGGGIAQADVYLIAVADGAIEVVSEYLQDKEGLVVHTSGARGLEALRDISRPGVFYPLQTFSRERNLDFGEIPLCLETGRPEDLPLLRTLAGTLSSQVLELGLSARRQLHLAAVFVNNFSNHMVYLGESLCREQGLAEDLLHPLLRETFSKLKTLSAFQAQTGPARRGDRVTRETHLSLLRDALQRELYQLISESIHKTYD